MSKAEFDKSLCSSVMSYVDQKTLCTLRLVSQEFRDGALKVWIVAVCVMMGNSMWKSCTFITIQDICKNCCWNVPISKEFIVLFFVRNGMISDSRKESFRDQRIDGSHRGRKLQRSHRIWFFKYDEHIRCLSGWQVESQLGDRGIAQFLQSLQVSCTSTVHILDCSNNAMGNQGCQELGKCISTGCMNELEEIILNSMDIEA